MIRFTTIVSWLAFFLILSFRVIPPLIMTSASAPLTGITGKGLLTAILWLLFLVLVAIPSLPGYHRDSHTTERDTAGKWSLRWLLFGVSGLALLILNNYFWTWISGSSALSGESVSLPPLSVLTVGFIAVSALWEELLYRLYLSEYVSDYGSILVFALSHRYMGWDAVGNALVAAIIFTVIFRRAGPRQHPWLAIILTGTIHFSYNLILYLSV